MRHRWALGACLLALVVRLVWNLWVHPVGDYAYSDMLGYRERAELLLSEPWRRHQYLAFFPYGTHTLVALILRVGRVFGAGGPDAALAVAFAAMGAAIVGLACDLARRVSRFAWVPPVLGVVLALHYPLVSLGGYLLSEIPTSLCLVAMAWCALRVLEAGEGGGLRPAAAFGVWASLGTIIRPQVLVAMALVVLWLAWAQRRRARAGVEAGQVAPALSLRHVAAALVPVVLVLGLSAARLHWHTERWGLVSENGPVNLVFGRCHARGVAAKSDLLGRRKYTFSPPAMLQLEKHSAARPRHPIQLDPYYADDARVVARVRGFMVDGHACRDQPCLVSGGQVEYIGYIGDADQLGRITARCVSGGGVARQVRYSLTHLVQLWAFNELWPDAANPAAPDGTRTLAWDRWARWSGRYVRWVWMVPALLGLGFAFDWQRAGMAVVALFGWSVMVVAALYFGSVRLRVPYDPFFALLGLELVATMVARVLARRGEVRGIGGDAQSLRG